MASRGGGNGGSTFYYEARRFLIYCVIFAFLLGTATVLGVVRFAFGVMIAVAATVIGLVPGGVSDFGTYRVAAADTPPAASAPADPGPAAQPKADQPKAKAKPKTEPPAAVQANTGG